MIHPLRKAKARELRGTALVRLDFNTEDDWRVKAAVPTLNLLLSRASKLVIFSHRGRPKGKDPSLSLRKQSRRLEELLKRKVSFLPHFRFKEIKSKVDKAKEKAIFLLENLRFLPGESKNDRGLAEKLSSLGDFYVNEAFAVSHRADASVDAITRFIPSYAGLGLEKEINVMSKAMQSRDKPLVIVVGGAKAHDKLGIIERFKNKADFFLLGGAPANTLLKMRGIDVKKSVVDDVPADKKMLLRIMYLKNIILPRDWKMRNGAILDIGNNAAAEFSRHIKSAKTIIWSGPLGLIEDETFATGSLTVAKAIAANRKAFSLTGGGETVSFLKKHGLDTSFSFISTGGGAMVEFLEGKKLPGIVALDKANFKRHKSPSPPKALPKKKQTKKRKTRK